MLSALEQGYEVYVVTDACGDCSLEAHERAVERMIQAGARPITALGYLCELQRDWARLETYDLTTGIAMKFGGLWRGDQVRQNNVRSPRAPEGLVHKTPASCGSSFVYPRCRVNVRVLHPMPMATGPLAGLAVALSTLVDPGGSPALIIW